MDFGDVGWNGEVRLLYVPSSQNLWVRPLDQPPLPDCVPDLNPWQSFALATPGHLVLARCHKNDSWLRGRVLEMTQEGARVFYMDCGRIEVHNEAQRLADMPPDLCSRPEVLEFTLDPTSTWSREEGKLLKRLVARKAASWWLVVVDRLINVDKSTDEVQHEGLEKKVLVGCLWYRLQGQIDWARFGPSSFEALDFPSKPSTNQVDCIGKRLKVHLPSRQPLLSPENIMVELQSSSFKKMKAELNQKGGGTPLSSLRPGCWLAVRTAEAWERAQLLEIRPKKALVKLVDVGIEKEVAYGKWRELAGTALLLPPMVSHVSLYGLETPQHWGKRQQKALADVLHMTGEGSISALDIVVHKISSPGGRWLVSLIDTVANNHQIFLNRLLVLEGLAVATNLPLGKVVFGTWEKFELPCSSDESNSIRGGGRKLNENKNHVERARVSQVEGLPKSEGGSRSDYGTLKPGTVSRSVVEKSSKGSSETKSVKLDEDKKGRQVSAPSKDLPPRRGLALLTNLTIKGEVWIVPEVWRSLQQQLQDDLSALSLGDQTTTDVKSLTEGEIVLALWEDANWYRGRVVSLLENNLLEVFFVDWGNTELMKREEVVRMKSVPACEKLEAIRDLAVPGFLHKVKLCKEKEMKVLQRLREVQVLASDWESPATYNMSTGEGGCLFLRILIREGERRFSLASHLISRGLAIEL